MNKGLSSVPGDAEPPSGSASEQEESAGVVSGRSGLQDAVQTQPQDSVVQDGVNAVQNHMFDENAKHPIENGPSNSAVVQKARNPLLYLLKIAKTRTSKTEKTQ